MDGQRRKPKQARSRATWEAIVEAASQILERQGPAALNTNSVAERAGVSIGTLYQYFPDKHAILIAAARRELGADAARLGARQRALVQALIAMLEGLGRLGGGEKARLASAAAAPSRKVRRGTRWELRVAEGLRHVLHVLVAPAEPVFVPIRIHANRRRD